MNFDLRWIVILLANFLLILLLAEMNHYLALFSLHVFAGGLLITFAALRLQLKPAFLANGITALLLDATAPLPPGVLFLLLMTVHTVVFAFRSNFTKESFRTATGIAICANVFIMLVVSLLISREAVSTGAFWQRTMADILLSQVAVAIGATWFFSLQLAALRMLGIHLEAEQREAQ